MTDWSACPAVERSPSKVSGTWLFKGTRAPVRALFENLNGGATADKFLEWFPGVTRDQVDAVLEHQAVLTGPLRSAFPDGKFSVASVPDEIARAEAELGVSLPDKLGLLYLESDGFREKKGNAAYLFPLDDLLEETPKLWSLHEVLTEAKLPDFTPFIFFGIPSGGGWWGIRHTSPFDIVAWDHHLLYEPAIEFEAMGYDIIDVFKADNAKYEDVKPHD